MASIAYILGKTAALDEIFPPYCYATDVKDPPLKDQCDVIRHYTKNSLTADGFSGAQVSVEVSDDTYRVRVSYDGPEAEDRLRAFADRHAIVLGESGAQKAIPGKRLMEEMGVWNPMSGYHANGNPKDGQCKWHLYPPLGFNVVGQRGILLMHYPPWQIVQQGTGLKVMTIRRWLTVLKAVGVPPNEIPFYQTFVNVNPIAAPGSGQSEYPNDYFPVMMASAFFSGPPERDYVRSMLELYVAPPGAGGRKYTLPLLVCGSDLYDPQTPGWFRVTYKDQLFRDGKVDKNCTPTTNMLQAGSVKIRPNSERETPYLISNHMIAAGVSGVCNDDRSKTPNIEKYEAQDLVAASFLHEYAKNPDLDPSQAKKLACQRWFGDDDGSGEPKPPAPEDQQIICALAQMDLFFVKTPSPHPTFTFEQAMERCKHANNGSKPCCKPIYPLERPPGKS